MSEHAVDKNRGFGSGTAGLIFLAGWATIAYVAALDSNNQFNADRFVRISIPALAVFGFAVVLSTGFRMVYSRRWSLPGRLPLMAKLIPDTSTRKSVSSTGWCSWCRSKHGNSIYE
uniref:Uncharacterized protein n=1 Tax=Marseillevirus LCMAC202 TaxID=2506606 RepID=A0A481YXV8_9VIRU|nr:MAG: uncharacterized protein LCMAC202_03900 [Marseillevirus LCMAC202]